MLISSWADRYAGRLRSRADYSRPPEDAWEDHRRRRKQLCEIKKKEKKLIKRKTLNVQIKLKKKKEKKKKDQAKSFLKRFSLLNLFPIYNFGKKKKRKRKERTREDIIIEQPENFWLIKYKISIITKTVNQIQDPNYISFVNLNKRYQINISIIFLRYQLQKTYRFK